MAVQTAFLEPNAPPSGPHCDSEHFMVFQGRSSCFIFQLRRFICWDDKTECWEYSPGVDSILLLWLRWRAVVHQVRTAFFIARRTAYLRRREGDARLLSLRLRDSYGQILTSGTLLRFGFGTEYYCVPSFHILWHY